LAHGHVETYRLPNALICLERLLQAEPDHLQALLLRARVHESLLYSQEAQEDYRRIVELDSNQDASRLHLAESLVDSGQFQEAQEHLMRLRQRQPGNRRVFLALARCERAQGRLDTARQLLEAVLAVQPRDPWASIERGRLALDLKQPEEAEKWFRQAAALAPS